MGKICKNTITPPPPRINRRKQSLRSGFTLIEMSIVLVIIGLIVGGILVGQDLIASAAIRSQISQIERYNTAVYTFRGKYGFLPGDIPDPQASQFGFAARGTGRAQGDGNGLLEGAFGGSATARMTQTAGETALFWRDLSTALLIDGSFSSATCCSSSGLISLTSTPSLNNYFPSAKIGQGNYIYVYSPLSTICCGIYTNAGTNYFGLVNIASMVDGAGDLSSTPTLSLTVAQAYNIDKKMDDGFPQTGKVTAQFVGTNAIYWAAGTASSATYGTSDTSATPPLSTTCYDNGGVAGVQQYSMAQNNGTGMNCALSFKFQ